MSKNRIVSSGQAANSEPIFLSPDSPELKLLDPKYVRIITGTGFDSVLPQIFGLDSSTPGLAPKEPPRTSANDTLSTAIQLDDIEKISGPTEYFVNGQKRFKFVIRVKNKNNLSVIDAKARKAPLG